MRKTLLDTNILSYFFRGQPNVVERMVQYSQFYESLTFSLLTYYEIKSGLLYRDATTLLTRFEELASESEILPLTLTTANIGSRIYANLRARGLLISPMDLLIAATAIEHNCVLITANVRHFENIPGLDYDNWAE